MRASTAIAMVVLAGLAMFAPAWIILRLPFVPNWPYVGLFCLGISVIAGGIYMALARRYLKRPQLITVSSLFGIFPVWLSVFALFWSYVRLTVEDNLSLDFSNGVVVEKYHSRNHDYLSVRVEVAGRGTLAVEGVSPASWDKVSAGTRVSKRSGTSDIIVESP